MALLCWAVGCRRMHQVFCYSGPMLDLLHSAVLITAGSNIRNNQVHALFSYSLIATITLFSTHA